MATSYSSVTISDLTNVGTSEQQTGSIAVAPNEGLYVDFDVTSHGTDTVTVRLQTSADGTTWTDANEVQFDTGETEPKTFGFIIGAPNVRFEAVASGSTDNPTVSFRAQRGPLNGA